VRTDTHGARLSFSDMRTGGQDVIQVSAPSATGADKQLGYNHLEARAVIHSILDNSNEKSVR
jgi:hypothetical protein